MSAAGIVASCGGGNETRATTDEPTEAFEWRFVDRAYPYTLGDDTFVCGEWQQVSSAGEVLGVDREWYPFRTMNRHLANVGTPEAVSYVTGEIRSALLAEGIRHIESCDAAREFKRLVNMRDALVPVREIFPSAADPAQNIEPDLPSGVNGELVDKVINGSSFDHLSSVFVGISDGMGCTGNLIGPNALVTAAHCSPVTSGFTRVRAWIQVGSGPIQCISHQVSGACPTSGANNAYVQRHPNFTVGPEFDQAVVIMNAGWFAPANTSARWTRFAADWGVPLSVGFNGNPVRIAGYGQQSDTLPNGTDRLGNSMHNITSMNGDLTVFGIPRLTASSSGYCKGDSGAGPFNTTLLNGTNLMLGIQSSPSQGGGGGICTPVGESMLNSVPDGNWLGNLVAFFGGACSTFSVAGSPYMRCW
jgi:hypothetical protein